MISLILARRPQEQGTGIVADIFEIADILEESANGHTLELLPDDALALLAQLRALEPLLRYQVAHGGKIVSPEQEGRCNG